MERSVQGLLAQDYKGAEIAEIMGVSFRYVRKIRLGLRTKRNQGTLIAEPGCRRNQGATTAEPECHNPVGTDLVLSDLTPKEERKLDSKTVSKKKERPKNGASLFGEFWKAYPRREGKLAAEAKYAATIKRGVEHSTIMAGLARYVAKIERERTEVKYVAHPATWLNQGRWEDEGAATSNYSGTPEEMRERYKESF
jgi:hypothetical protein